MTTTIISETKIAHPCQYCNRSCIGKQCKQCHLNMIASREATCVDCSETFSALRKDGTKRSRCNVCQEEYTKLHIAKCPDCGENFHALLKNGKNFSKCLNCYKKNFTTCTNCSKTTRIEYPLCKDCYVSTKVYKKKEKESTEYPSHPCKTQGCDNKTSYSLCSKCNNSLKDVENEYMISTFKYEVCQYRGKGNFKYCETHRA
jgi:hypothetical protein